MNIFSRIYCRAYQGVMRAALPIMPYREPKMLTDNLELLEVLVNHAKNKVLLVTDSGIRKIGLTKPLEELLSFNGIKVSVYDETVANPTVDNVKKAVEIYKENECQAIIAFGGGSPMDCAKAAGAMIACPNKTLKNMKGLLKVNHKLPLLIAVPTTAGTGSETTLTAVITDAESHHKYTINDFNLIPSYALLDASLTLGLPKHMTSTTGLDALTHAIEAYIGRSTTKTTRQHALNAIKLIFENLLDAYEDGTNFKARENMLKASYMAGMAFTKSYVGYVHAIAHTLGGKYNVPHGLANAIILPYVLKKYGKSAHKKLFKIARHCGLCDENTTFENGAKILIEKIEQMNKIMKIQTKIVGINKEDIESLAKTAAKEANPLYPVPKLFNAKELESIYFEIMG